MNLLKAIDILMKASTGGSSFGSQTIGQPVTPGSYAPVLASSLQPKAEKIKGGKADGLTLSDIAKMHDVPLKDLRAQYAKGVKVEREHTESPAIAAEIALDHLYESPTYYSDLEKVEKAALAYSAYMDKSLGRKRDTMPQIDEGSLDDFLIHFAQKSGGEGVKIKKVVKKASALIPSQNEINDAKVLNWQKADKPKPIIISKDNYIIDGHHQWAAALEDGDDSELVCIKVDLDAKELLRRANLLKIATKKDIEDRVMKSVAYVFEDEMVKAWSTDLAKRVNGRWVTMNGQPVLIGLDGNVHAGPEKVINAINSKGKSKDLPEIKKRDKAEAEKPAAKQSGAIEIKRSTEKAHYLSKDGVDFWVQKKWLRDDGTLTPKGEESYKEAAKVAEKSKEAGINLKGRLFSDKIKLVGQSDKAYKFAVTADMPDGSKKDIEFWSPKAMAELKDGKVAINEKFLDEKIREVFNKEAVFTVSGSANLKETDSAYILPASLDFYNTERTVKRDVFIPKSVVKKDAKGNIQIPKWIIDKKVADIEDFVGRNAGGFNIDLMGRSVKGLGAFDSYDYPMVEITPDVKYGAAKDRPTTVYDKQLVEEGKAEIIDGKNKPVGQQPKQSASNVKPGSQFEGKALRNIGDTSSATDLNGNPVKDWMKPGGKGLANALSSGEALKDVKDGNILPQDIIMLVDKRIKTNAYTPETASALIENTLGTLGKDITSYGDKTYKYGAENEATRDLVKVLDSTIKKNVFDKQSVYDFTTDDLGSDKYDNPWHFGAVVNADNEKIIKQVAADSGMEVVSEKQQGANKLVVLKSPQIHDYLKENNKAYFDKFEKSMNLFDAFDILLKAKTDKVATVMREFKEGELTTHGRPVTDRKQAIAIALNEAGLSKAGVKFEDMKDDELYDLYSQGGDKVYSGISAATMRKVYDAYDGKIKLSKSAISKSSQTFSDYPQSATTAAKRAIEWKEKHGDEVKAGTQVGWTRAHQLANREPLSLDTVKRIAQFARHLKNASVNPKHKDEPWKDRGHVAVLLWGGEEMINWAKRTVDKHENI